MPGIWSIVLGCVAGIVVLLMILGYVKAPPDQAYIISGLRKKIVIGRASIWSDWINSA